MKKEEAPYSDSDAGPLPPKPKVTDAEKKNTPERKNSTLQTPQICRHPGESS
jgi:hypothetical protein